MLSQLVLHHLVQEARKGLDALGPHLWGPDQPWVQQWDRRANKRVKLAADDCMHERAAQPADDDCQCARPALALAEEEFRAAQRGSESAAAEAATAHTLELARLQGELAAARDAQDTALAAEREARKMAETQGAAMARAVATASADAENYVSAVREDAARAAAQHRSELDGMRTRVAGAEAAVGAAAAAQADAESVAATLRGEWAAMEEASRGVEASMARANEAAMLADRAQAAATVAAEELAEAKGEVSECRRRLEAARAGERRAEEAEATLRASQERARMISAELAGSKQALARLNATVSLFTGHTPLQATDLCTTAAASSSSTSLAESPEDATGRPLQLAFIDPTLVSETVASLFSGAVDFGDSSARAVSALLRAVPLPPELSRLRDLTVPDLSDLSIDTSMAVQPSSALLIAPLALLLLFCFCTRSSSPRRAQSKAGPTQLPGEQPATTKRRGGGSALPPRPAEAVEGANCAASPQQLVGKAPPGRPHAAHVGTTHSLDAAELAALKQQLLPTVSAPPPAPVGAGAQLTPDLERALDPADQDAAGALQPEGGSEYRCALVATERVRDAWVAYRAFHSWVLAAAAMYAEAALRSAGEDACASQRAVADLEHRLLKERATFARLTTPGGSVRSAVGSARSHRSAVSEASVEISASLKSLRTNLSLLSQCNAGPKPRTTPGRLASVARRLLPRLADHVSPSRILSSMLKEVNLVMAEEVALGGGLRDSPDTRRGSSSSAASALGSPDGCMTPSPSWGQLTSENVHILEKRSSPLAIPELLARNSAAGGAALAEEPLLDHQAMGEEEFERDGSQGSEWDGAVP